LTGVSSQCDSTEDMLSFSVSILQWMYNTVTTVIDVSVADVQTTLADVFHQFTDAVSQWQTFWDVVDEIDANTCVLEPEHPTRSATYRRLALGLY